jgi:hypothetical protein
VEYIALALVLAAVGVYAVTEAVTLYRRTVRRK